MKVKRGVSFFLGLGLVLAGVVGGGAEARATDIRDVLTFTDAANGASTYNVRYENDVTTMEVQFRFDGAAVTKILTQASGVGSDPASFYSTVTPHYDEITATKPFAKGNFNYDPENDTFTTPEAIEAEFERQVPECSAYYHRIWPSVDENTFCSSKSYWDSNSASFWQDYAHVEYKKDGVWVDAQRDNVNFKSPETNAEIRSVASRLVDALGLESEDELVYGENWRVKANETATAWIYRDDYRLENATKKEYFKIYGTVEAAFDYMTVDEDGEYVYQPSFEAAMASEYETVIVNKDTEVDRLEIPAGKTVIEREGELTVADPVHSQVLGEYIKQDGESYQLVKITQTGAGGQLVVEDGEVSTPLETGFYVVGSTFDLAVDLEDGKKVSSLTIGGEAVDLTEKDEEGRFVESWSVEVLERELAIVAEYDDYEIEVTPIDDEWNEMEGDLNRAIVDEFVAGQLAELLESGEDENEFVQIYRADYVREVLRRGGSFMTSLEGWDVDLESEMGWTIEARDEILAQIGENEKIALSRAEVLLIWSAFNGEPGADFGEVFKLNTPITMSLEIPEEFREAPEGYTRKFTVIRGHMAVDGTATAERIEAEFDGEKVNFENDKFSVFTVVYEDVIEAPAAANTGRFTGIVEAAKASHAELAVLAVVMILGGIKMVEMGIRRER